MRIALAAFAASLLLSSFAFAQTAMAAPATNTGTTANTGGDADDDDDDTATTSAANPATTNPATPGTQKTGPKHAKREACRAQWDAQTTHSGKKKDFVQSCMTQSG